MSFAYQQQQITDRNQSIKDLNDKLESDRKAQDDKDAQIAQLQKQIATANAEPAEPSPAAAGPIAGQPAGAGAAAGAAGAAPAQPTASEAVRRDAQQWSAMDPETAAALVQKLPTNFVSTVFCPDVARLGRSHHGCSAPQGSRFDRRKRHEPSDFGSTGPINRIAGLARPFAVAATGLSRMKGGEE